MSALPKRPAGPFVKELPPSERVKREKPLEQYAPNYYSVPGQKSPKPYKVLGKWYRPLAHAQGFCQQGIASWYGKDFHGKPTATGETYNMYGISAAHKILPMGTIVRVRNLKNGRILDMRINDRGPFIPGRIIDLSQGAPNIWGLSAPEPRRWKLWPWE